MRVQEAQEELDDMLSYIRYNSMSVKVKLATEYGGKEEIFLTDLDNLIVIENCELEKKKD